MESNPSHESHESHESFQIQEIAGTESQGIPMTESQAYYLHEVVDPEIERLIALLDAEKQNARIRDENLAKTILRD